MTKIGAIILAISVTTNIFLGKGMLAAGADTMKWQSFAVKADTEIVQRDQLLREHSEALVACLNKLGLK